MNTLTIFLICAVIGSVARVFALTIKLAKYVAAFQDAATNLYNVTIERDKLSIQNAGLNRELARECVKNEELRAKLADPLGVQMFSTVKPEHRE